MKARLSNKTQVSRMARLRERFGISAAETGKGMTVIKPPQRADAAKRTDWAIEVIRRWKVGRESGVTAIHPTEEIYCLSRAAHGTPYRMDSPETHRRAGMATKETYRLRKLANPPVPKPRRPRQGAKKDRAYHQDWTPAKLERRTALVRKMLGRI